MTEKYTVMKVVEMVSVRRGLRTVTYMSGIKSKQMVISTVRLLPL